jgi:hypothetical protein
LLRLLCPAAVNFIFANHATHLKHLKRNKYLPAHQLSSNNLIDIKNVHQEGVSCIIRLVTLGLGSEFVSIKKNKDLEVQ